MDALGHRGTPAVHEAQGRMRRRVVLVRLEIGAVRATQDRVAVGTAEAKRSIHVVGGRQEVVRGRDLVEGLPKPALEVIDELALTRGGQPRVRLDVLQERLGVVGLHGCGHVEHTCYAGRCAPELRKGGERMLVVAHDGVVAALPGELRDFQPEVLVDPAVQRVVGLLALVDAQQKQAQQPPRLIALNDPLVREVRHVASLGLAAVVAAQEPRGKPGEAPRPAVNRRHVRNVVPLRKQSPRQHIGMLLLRMRHQHLHRNPLKCRRLSTKPLPCFFPSSSQVEIRGRIS